MSEGRVKGELALLIGCSVRHSVSWGSRSEGLDERWVDSRELGNCLGVDSRVSRRASRPAAITSGAGVGPRERGPEVQRR